MSVRHVDVKAIGRNTSKEEQDGDTILDVCSWRMDTTTDSAAETKGIEKGKLPFFLQDRVSIWCLCNDLFCMEHLS